MRTVTTALLMFCTLGASPLAAAAPQSRYTSIENKHCKFDPVGKQPGDAEDQLKTCPGVGGARVLVNAFHTRLRIGFAWTGRPKVADVMNVVEAWSAGMKIEWRGLPTAKGFDPYAATVRMLFADAETGKAKHQVLAVIRIRRGQACLIGAVDIAANKDGYDLARTLADAAPSFTCGKDKPRIAGVETEWAKAIVGEEKP
jgi:hypothetical protein